MTPEDKEVFDRLLKQFLAEHGLVLNGSFFKLTANQWVGRVFAQYVKENNLQ